MNRAIVTNTGSVYVNRIGHRCVDVCVHDSGKEIYKVFRALISLYPLYLPARSYLYQKVFVYCNSYKFESRKRILNAVSSACAHLFITSLFDQE